MLVHNVNASKLVSKLIKFSRKLGRRLSLVDAVVLLVAIDKNDFVRNDLIEFSNLDGPGKSTFDRPLNHFITEGLLKATYQHKPNTKLGDHRVLYSLTKKGKKFISDL